MQFTNWKLNGCSTPNPKRLLKPIEKLGSEDLEALKSSGRVLNQATIALERAAAGRTSRLQTPGSPVKQRTAEFLRSKTGPQKKPVTGLERLFMVAAKRNTPVRLDLEDMSDLERGYLVPREGGIDIRFTDLFDSEGNASRAGLASFVDYLSKVLGDSTPRKGAARTALSISRRNKQQAEDGTWTDARPPYGVEALPFQGRAQQFANAAGGDFNKFMELMDSEGYVVFDFETTGLNEFGNVPVQVSAIRYKDGKEVNRLNIFMNPERSISEWTAKSVRLPGSKTKFVTDEWLAKQMSTEDGLRQLSDFVGRSIIGGHNIAYDRDTVLEPLLKKYKIKFRASGSFDTIPIARQIVPDDVSKRKTLGALSEAFDVKLSKAHSADDDSQATNGILRAMMKWAAENGASTDIFDADIQNERRQKSIERYERELQEFDNASVIRIDLVDVFPDDGATPAKRQKELDAAIAAANESGAPFVMSAWNNKVFNSSGEQEYSFAEMVNPSDPKARMANAPNELSRAFARLEGRDNMNLDNFTNEEIAYMVNLFGKVQGFESINKEDPDSVYKIIDQGAENLLQLMNSVTPEQRAQYAMWYDSANVFANDLADRYGVATETASAVIAALSPTQDWNQNIALAEHVIKLTTDKDFRISEDFAERLHAERIAKYEGIVSPKPNGNRAKIADKQLELEKLKASLSSASDVAKAEKKIEETEKRIKALQDEYDRALASEAPSLSDFKGKGVMLARFTDVDESLRPLIIQRHAKWYGAEYMGQTIDRNKGSGLYSYRMTPNRTDGVIGYDLSTSEPNLARVQSISQYGSALRIISADNNGTPSMEAIDKGIGKGSKVRSFYNNIMYPGDKKYMDYTSDTHAFGAATLIPVTASHDILDMMFDPYTKAGVSKAYPLFRAMGVLAADRWRDRTGEELLPRQVQSITWEAIRNLVPTEVPSLNDPSLKVKDNGLKGHLVNTMAQIATLSSGDKPLRPDLVGRQVELIQELVNDLVKVPKGERAAAELAFRKRYNLSEKDKPDLPRAIKISKTGATLLKDQDSGKWISLSDSTAEEVVDDEDEALDEIIEAVEVPELPVTPATSPSEIARTPRPRLSLTIPQGEREPIVPEQKSTKQISNMDDGQFAELLNSVATLQRGEPERAMLAAQSQLQGGALSNALEHIGDLTHRINERSGAFGVDHVKPKVERMLALLNAGYPFEREVESDLARVDEAAVRATMNVYAQAHADLPVYNQPSLYARDAAIALGKMDFDEARRNLDELNKLVQLPDEDWKNLLSRPWAVMFTDDQEGLNTSKYTSLAKNRLTEGWVDFVNRERDGTAAFSYFVTGRLPATLSGHKLHISTESSEEVREALARILPILEADKAMGFKLGTEAFFKYTQYDHPQKGKGVTIYLPRVATLDDDIDKIVQAMAGWRGKDRGIDGDTMIGNGVGRRYELREPIETELDMGSVNDAKRYRKLYIPSDPMKPKSLTANGSPSKKKAVL
jgi:DNA polymerase III epsilon subunit-like protein